MKSLYLVFRRGVAAAVLLLTALILSTVLAPTGYAASINSLQQTDQPPVCQNCHADEYKLWQESTHATAAANPQFQTALEVTQDQELCLQCHTTGSDTATGEGISCEACHGPYVEGHPGGATMVLPMESETCRTCHQATFVEWEQSAHGDRNIECFDCHLSHSQGLRTGSEETLCSACHEARQMQATHVTHNIDGLECSGCHMPQQTTEPHQPMGMSVSSGIHDFDVNSQACLDCHTQNLSAPTAGATSVGAELATVAQVAVSPEQVQSLEHRLSSMRNIAVAGMGLAFGIGGFIGLVVGIVAMALLRRPNTPEEGGKES
jgi:Cytochrome c554 and c-prime